MIHFSAKPTCSALVRCTPIRGDVQEPKNVRACLLLSSNFLVKKERKKIKRFILQRKALHWMTIKYLENYVILELQFCKVLSLGRPCITVCFAQEKKKKGGKKKEKKRKESYTLFKMRGPLHGD